MKKGFITIRDRHFQDNGKNDDFGEITTACEVGVDGESIVVNYYESIGELNDCLTCIMIKKDRVTMMRTGRFRTGMIFENHKRHISCYETPFGEIMIGIYTNAMFVSFDEYGGVIEIAYTIDTNGDLVSENEIKITVEVKED